MLCHFGESSHTHVCVLVCGVLCLIEKAPAVSSQMLAKPCSSWFTAQSVKRLSSEGLQRPLKCLSVV